MKTYKIEITETLQKTIEIEADNEKDALHKVIRTYENEEVILDYNNIVDVSFKSI